MKRPLTAVLVLAFATACRSLAGPFYHHGGSSNGGSAFRLVFPRQRFVVATASNAFGQWSDREALTLARLFMARDGLTSVNR